MSILVTGAAGYIGSHTVVALLEAGHEVVAVDNFDNSKPLALERVAQITGKQFAHYRADVRDRAALANLFKTHAIKAVIHFAGLKAVGESVQKPLAYYDNNLVSTLVLLETMAEHQCFKLVFSSSATVYGAPTELPLHEKAALSATNPYGRTKLFIEEILRDLAVSDARWKIALLRYFNPVGAHESGLIGEDPNGIPNNLFPFIAQVATGRLPTLKVFGGDYPTPDGTGVRDYIHVSDLAVGHVKALEHLEELTGAEAINLGTGQGYSVLEAIKAFSAACGKPLNYQIVARRPGDVAACYADPSKARRLLGWEATRTLSDMCRDHWRWQSRNPMGYV
ncbi:MAG: UDP-glucose 4-epimerase GalE [Nibricoccus sp.]